jgi:hypothetical protein
MECNMREELFMEARSLNGYIRTSASIDVHLLVLDPYLL